MVLHVTVRLSTASREAVPPAWAKQNTDAQLGQAETDAQLFSSSSVHPNPNHPNVRGSDIGFTLAAVRGSGFGDS